MPITKDQFLTPVTVATEEVPVPELGFGDHVMATVRGLTAAEREEYDNDINRTSINAEGKVVTTLDLSNTMAKLVVKGLIDEAGQRVFTDKDATEVGKKPHALVKRLFDAIQRLSGMDRKSEEKQKKTLTPGQTGGSPSN